jgi:DNA-binding transcriptional regulator YiaG
MKAPSMTGDQMRVAREAIRMTRAEVAASLGVCERTVERWESGRRIPEPIAKLFRILHDVERQ